MLRGTGVHETRSIYSLAQSLNIDREHGVFGDAFEGTAADAVSSGLGEETLHHVEPRS
jgi:hypothetical protein